MRVGARIGRATRRQYSRELARVLATVRAADPHADAAGTIILLFGNAFGAYATAYQLTSGPIPLVPLLIGNQISGDVLHNPGLGYALTMGMVVIMASLIVVYTVLQRRAERWRR